MSPSESPARVTCPGPCSSKLWELQLSVPLLRAISREGQRVNWLGFACPGSLGGLFCITSSTGLGWERLSELRGSA